MKTRIILSGMILSFLFITNFALASAPSVPTLNEVNPENLIVSGLTQKNTDIVVYVDDEFIGMADVKVEESGTDNFNINLTGLLEAGDHQLKVAAKDKESLSLSGFSQVEKFKVSEERKKQPAITKLAVSENAEIGDKVSPAVEQSVVTESKESEQVGNKVSKKALYWNLAIFSFFLVAVIAWIYFVNRELEKEKALKIEEESKKQ